MSPWLAGAQSVLETGRYRDLSSAGTTTITLGQTIPAGNTAVNLGSFEAPTSMGVASVSDSKGNAWQVLAGPAVNNSVHQAYIAAAYIVDTLNSGDTLTITWSGAIYSIRFGTVLSLAGLATNALDVAVTNESYGSYVTAPGTTSATNDLLVGIVQTDQGNAVDGGGYTNVSQLNLAYVNGNWSMIGNEDAYASPSASGLLNAYVWTAAAGAATYDPGGQYYSAGAPYKDGYTVLWAALRPSGSFSQTLTSQTLTSQTPTPAVKIVSPANGATVTTPSLLVSVAATESGLGSTGVSSVTVNGVSASSGSSPTNWSATLSLTPGQNTITAVAEDVLNHAGRQQITVTYDSPSTPGANYYVDFVSGNDTNSGTSTGAPFQHCPGDSNATSIASSTVLTPGNTVFFKGGVTYVGQINVSNDGSSSAPIGYDGNSAGTWGAGMASIDCQSNYYHAFVAQHLLGPHNNVIINNFDISHLKNNFGSPATNLVNTVQGSQDQPGTTNVAGFNGDNSGYDIGGVFVYGANWQVLNCNVHESENWWFRALATGSTYNPIYCQQVGVNIYGGTGILVSNCSFWGIGRDCVDAMGANITIIGCNMGGPNTLALANRGWFAVGVRVAAVSNCSIIKCTMHDGWQYEGDDSAQRCHAGDWIHVYGNNNGVMDGNDVFNLLIDSCWMYNDYAFQWNNGTANIYLSSDIWSATVRNCLIVNPQHLAIWAGAGAVSNFNVFNNTVVNYNQPNGGSLSLFESGSPNSLNVTNNILVNLGANGACLPVVCSQQIPGSAALYSDYNVLYNPVTVGYGSVRYMNSDISLSAWTAATGNDSHSLAANPKFVSLPASGATSSSGNYALSAGSPALAAGTSLGALFSTDINGSPRGARWCVGAITGGGSSPPAPPSNLKVQ